METKGHGLYLHYYGKSGKWYHVDIPQALNDKMVAMEGESWCDNRDNEANYTCMLPKYHDGHFHMSLGISEVCAIWPRKEQPCSPNS